MEIVRKYLKKADLFARPITMTLDKKRNFRSVEGGLLSIAVLAIICYITYEYSKNLILRTSPFYFFIRKSF